jgi:Uma2 family endonuclease
MSTHAFAEGVLPLPADRAIRASAPFDAQTAATYNVPVLDLSEIAPEVPRPLKRVEYDKLGELGAFDDERVELLDGVIVPMTPRAPSHDAPIDRLAEKIFIRALGSRARVRIQASFAASESSEPEPDVCVVPRREYDQAHPDEAYLVVEVAISSLPKDRGVKARLYAASDVVEYWIVNVTDRAIEVHAAPSSGVYASVRVFHNGEHIRLVRFPDVVVSADDVLIP